MGEACKMAGFSRPTMRRLLLEGDVLGKKHGTGGHWRISEKSLLSHMDPQDVHEKALEHVRRLGL